MATKKTAKPKYPVREPNADDSMELLGIVSAAGGGERLGDAVALLMQASQQKDAGVVQGAAIIAITDGLHAALRDRSVRQDAVNFIYSLWAPKLSVGDGETFEEKKRDEWKKLPMRAPMEIIDSFRKTDNFTDFLDFFTSMMPSQTDSTDSSTPSNEPTDIQTAKS